MAKRWAKAGSQSVSVDLFLQDSSATTGAALTGLSAASSGLNAYYRRQPIGSATRIALVSVGIGSGHVTGAFVEAHSAMSGIYRLDLPDAALASGVEMVSVLLCGATNLAPVPLEIELTEIDNQDVQRAGLNALPASGEVLATGTTLAELSQAAPSATPTLPQAVMLLYMALRNKRTTTSSEDGIHNDAGTKIAKATLSDDGTTTTKEEYGSGA